MNLHTLTLRQAIIERLQGKSISELQQVIEEAIGQEERVLPGLGVILEKSWHHLSEQTKTNIIEVLHAQILPLKNLSQR